MTTVAPSRASSRTVARPSPLPPPVTTARRPVRSGAEVSGSARRGLVRVGMSGSVKSDISVRVKEVDVQIGELSERTGASVRSLRYYEQQGLLVSSRRPNGYREYPANAVATVETIRALLDIGLSTAL